MWQRDNSGLWDEVDKVQEETKEEKQGCRGRRRVGLDRRSEQRDTWLGTGSFAL